MYNYISLLTIIVLILCHLLRIARDISRNNLKNNKTNYKENVKITIKILLIKMISFKGEACIRIVISYFSVSDLNGGNIQIISRKNTQDLRDSYKASI